MLEPVSTSTIFSWPRAAAGRRSAPPRKTVKNLQDLVRTRPLHLAKVLVKVSRAANTQLSRVSPETNGGRQARARGRRYSWAEYGAKSLPDLQTQSTFSPLPPAHMLLSQ